MYVDRAQQGLEQILSGLQENIGGNELERAFSTQLLFARSDFSHSITFPANI